MSAAGDTGNAWSLSIVQRWMLTVIQHPGGIAQGLQEASVSSVDDVIHRTSRQTSRARLQIYADAYLARLLEVLKGEYPALLQAVGEELFAEFAVGYLRHHPPQSYTLSELGRRFPHYLSETRPPRSTQDVPDWADFLIDCSLLERLYAEVFDGPGPERVTESDRLQWTLPTDPEVFLRSRLQVASWVHLVELQFPVHEFVSAVRRGNNPEIPAPQSTWLVVSRRDFIVRRVSVSAEEYAVLAALKRGETVEVALSILATQKDGPEIAAETIHRWFSNWVIAGYLRGLDSGSMTEP